MQRRQSHLAARIALQQDGHHLVVALLHGDRQRRETVLRRQTLVRTVGQQQSHHRVVILLRRHVQRREAVLRLRIHQGMMLQQQLHHLLLAGQRRNVQRRVALLRGVVHDGAALQQFGDDVDVPVLGGQMQSIEAVLRAVKSQLEMPDEHREWQGEVYKTYRIAGVDVDIVLQVFKNFVQIARTGRPQKGCVAIVLFEKQTIVVRRE